MAKTSSKKHIFAKYDVVIKAKATTTRIVDINNEIVRFESNDKGQVIRKHYSGVHWDTVESTTLLDGNATLTIRYLHITNKGESHEYFEAYCMSLCITGCLTKKLMHLDYNKPNTHLNSN
jgi:hypothetical protein